MRTRRFGTWMLGLVVATGLTGLLLAGSGDKHEHSGEKAKVGEPAPHFSLQDTEGETHKLADYLEDDKIVVLEWFNPDCPYVKKHYEKKKTSTMNALASKYQSKGVVWLAVNSTHYADAKENRQWKQKWDINHPVLVDQSGEVAKKYGAKTTPHMYIIRPDGELMYNGAIDSNDGAWPKEDAQVTNYVDQALSSMLAGEPVSTRQTRPYGCSIKYKN